MKSPGLAPGLDVRIAPWVRSGLQFCRAEHQLFEGTPWQGLGISCSRGMGSRFGAVAAVG